MGKLIIKRKLIFSTKVLVYIGNNINQYISLIEINFYTMFQGTEYEICDEDNLYYYTMKNLHIFLKKAVNFKEIEEIEVI